MPARQVMSEAQKLGAVPFDIPSVELGHHGKQCSFEAILIKYNLYWGSCLRITRENRERRRHRQHIVESTRGCSG